MNPLLFFNLGTPEMLLLTIVGLGYPLLFFNLPDRYSAIKLQRFHYKTAVGNGGDLRAFYRINYLPDYRS